MSARYQRVSVIGKGSFGRCWLVIGERGQQCILKEIDVSKMPAKQKEEATNEVQVLSKLKHPYIINYRGSYVEDGFLCIITDYAEKGDLYRAIHRQRAMGRLFPECLVLRWFAQISLALKHMHDRHILHRDLKTQNIFLSGAGDGNVKVGDFGISRVLQHTQDCAKTAIGTPFYLSPEICQEKPYSFKSDVWSLGCVLFELATLRHAFDATSMQGLVMKILRGMPPELPSVFSHELRHLVPEMLAKDPLARPSVDEVLRRSIVRASLKMLIQEESERRNKRPTGSEELKAGDPPAAPHVSGAGQPALQGSPQHVERKPTSSAVPAIVVKAREEPKQIGCRWHSVAKVEDKPRTVAESLSDARTKAKAEIIEVPQSFVQPLEPLQPQLPFHSVQALQPAERAASPLHSPSEKQHSRNSAKLLEPRQSERLPATALQQSPRPRTGATIVRADGAVLASKAVLQQHQQQQLLHQQQQLKLQQRAVTPEDGAEGLRFRGQELKVMQRLPISQRKAAQMLAEAEKRRKLREKESQGLRAFVKMQRHARGAGAASESPRSSDGRCSSSEGGAAADADGREDNRNSCLAPEASETTARAITLRPPEASQPLQPQEEPCELIATLREGLSLAEVPRERVPPAPEVRTADCELPDLLKPRFLRPDGEEIRLPVGERDSLSYRIEALRVYLERELSLKEFLLAYWYLQNQSSTAAENETSELRSLVSEKTLRYLPLVHQLIVCEDQCFVQ